MGGATLKNKLSSPFGPLKCCVGKKNIAKYGFQEKNELQVMIVRQGEMDNI